MCRAFLVYKYERIRIESRLDVTFTADVDDGCSVFALQLL
jgi:hypothetical protein